MKYAVGWISLAFAVVVLSAGCMSKKVVYIPQEWQTPLPKSTSSTPPAHSGLKNTASAPSSSSPSSILKPPPAITEKDVPAGSEAAASSPAKKPAPPPPPQHMAAMHLVDQGKAALAQGKPDAAISVLEQAIQVDVHNGEAFLQLARAWRMKASRNKALEFARKAEVLFHEEKGKMKEVYLFQAELYKEMGDAAKAEQYRKKASGL